MHEFNSNTFLMCLTVFLMTYSVVAQYEVTQQEIIDDLPKNTDFDYYLRVLETAVDFCARNERHISMNLKFGLFMIDLNLRPAMKQDLPAQMRTRMINIFQKTEALATYFYDSRLQKNVSKLESEMTNVFHNSTTWSKPIKFHIDLLNKTVMYNKDQLEMFYGRYEAYSDNVSQFGDYRPTPTQSDDCVLDLLEKGPRVQRSMPNCVAHPNCRKLVADGSDYGYGLTHRMLFMIIARFYRKCVVFGEREDKERMDALCTMAFHEAQYIAANYFQMLDLMAEQITLCGLMGHAQFYRNYWLKTLVQFQTPEGCFYEENNETDVYHNDTSYELLLKQCNPHFTAVGLSSVASAIRYILETGRFY